MLQQGKFVADIVYYYGEDSNITACSRASRRRFRPATTSTTSTPTSLKNRLTVSPDGLLTTATGMSYRVLALDPNSQHMPLAVLRKIRDLVNAGAVVVGPKPIESPSLADDAGRVQDDRRPAVGPAATGKGKVYGPARHRATRWPR